MRQEEIWPFLFFVGVLLFNWPLMDIFGKSLPYYLYWAWVLFIVLIGCIAMFKGRRRRGNDV